MSYEDSFEREASDQRAYDSFESWYVFENLKPPTIGKWEWLLMFDRVRSRETYTEAAHMAREMARELEKPVTVQSPYEGCFIVRPEDYYKSLGSSLSWTYAQKRFDFIKALVVEERYPDLVKISTDSNESDRHRILRHYHSEICEQHRLWLEAAHKQAPAEGAA